MFWQYNEKCCSFEEKVFNINTVHYKKTQPDKEKIYLYFLNGMNIYVSHYISLATTNKFTKL